MSPSFYLQSKEINATLTQSKEINASLTYLIHTGNKVCSGLLRYTHLFKNNACFLRSEVFSTENLLLRSRQQGIKKEHKPRCI